MMRNQAQIYAKRWYEDAVRLRPSVKNGELYLVTGADKCANWCLGAFPHASGTSGIDFNSNLNSRQFHHINWGSGAEARICEPPENRKNQCAFIRGFSVLLAAEEYKELKANSATSHPDEMSSRGEPFSWKPGESKQNLGGSIVVCDLP
jgi:hypothetical protein